ncbi:copper resistance CopC family protein [Acrocarpospora corrugata]|uniref:copper resistance CopC family protein n=1 Tax=Acrocarpospora corrugata TaxID=35763 RepID=UPI00147813B1|nr:copper resistance protein CopC [Acrocarpospora corrugata]
MFGLVATIGVVAQPAAAHGQLAVSVPAKDSTVGAPMEKLELYFTEKPAYNAYFAVVSPSGRRLDGQWSHGEPKRLDEPVRELFLINGTWEPKLFETGFPAMVPVGYWPEQGVYTVKYVSRASDGELVKGEVRFSYDGKIGKAPAGWKAPDSEPDPALLVEPSAVPSPGVQPGAETQASQGPQLVQPTSLFSQPAPVAAEESSGSDGGFVVWLIPAVLVGGVLILLVSTARRPANKIR